MKTLIVGLGNIAAIHGWVWARAGVDITHVVRPGKLKKYDRPVKMDVLDLRDGFSPHSQSLYRPRVIDRVDPAIDYDLVMLPTKGDQLIEALKQYRDLVPEAIFMPFCARWQNLDQIDELLPRSRYLWGYATANGGREGDSLYVNLRPDPRLGMLKGSDPEIFEAVCDQFRQAGFVPDIKANMLHWLWTHHAINCGVIGTALYAGGIAEMASDPAFMIYMIHAVREAIEILAARGVDISLQPDTVDYLKEPIDEFAKSYSDLILNTEYGQRVIKYGHYKGNLPEMASFYLDVLDTGLELGLSLPHLLALRPRIEELLASLS